MKVIKKYQWLLGYHLRCRGKRFSALVYSGRKIFRSYRCLMSCLRHIQAIVLFLILQLGFCASYAVSHFPDIYTFDSIVQQQRFEKITTELRCLVCQNESLADSNAQLAKDLRHEIYVQVKNNANDKNIKAYLVERYGQFILFKPAFNGLTILLWVAPFLFLIIAFFILIMLRGRKRKTMQELTLSEEEKKQLNFFLKK